MGIEATATTVSEIDAIQSLYTDLASTRRRIWVGQGQGERAPTRLRRAVARDITERPMGVCAAVGNPFALAPLRAGEVVVDLGCGAGADLCGARVS